MSDLNKDISDGNLTQKDIVQLLLHNAQHMVTREELKTDITELRNELKSDINELKTDITELRNELKTDIKELRNELKFDIALSHAKFDKIQWLIVATIVSVLLKDY
jgi:hypothetical protein